MRKVMFRVINIFGTSPIVNERITTHTNQDIANMINSALLEPMQDYTPLSCLLPIADDSELLVASPSDAFNALLQLNQRKAGGADGINNWLLWDYADFLTSLVCNILNALFAEQKLPRSWKDADVTPLIKVEPVTTIAKHIRPFSLTPALSKSTQDFVFSKCIGPAVLETIASPNGAPFHQACPRPQNLALGFSY
ncbi:hypothetical protein AWC38_SpisGene20386 [Stylophora pistillata]|uniref:RNA-directed DNA polymerase from mobile element jockey n=1 Tax=Stylophora pistillata TaxID=50429 RepID=A0A2B4RGK3_STYPI|nr:hypothetical protein AWC38_SpisGene20386 [Stylophora pistillata]